MSVAESRTRVESPIVNICAAPLTKHGLDHGAAAAAAAASAPTEMSTLLRMMEPRVCRSLCLHERARPTPSADSRSACEPSANATVLLLVNTAFKSTNCSRCHAAQAGRRGGTTRRTQAGVVGQLSQSAPRRGSYYGYFQISQIDFDGLLQRTSRRQ